MSCKPVRLQVGVDYRSVLSVGYEHNYQYKYIHIVSLSLSLSLSHSLYIYWVGFMSLGGCRLPLSSQCGLRTQLPCRSARQLHGHVRRLWLLRTLRAHSHDASHVRQARLATVRSRGQVTLPFMASRLDEGTDIYSYMYMCICIYIYIFRSTCSRSPRDSRPKRTSGHFPQWERPWFSFSGFETGWRCRYIYVNTYMYISIYIKHICPIAAVGETLLFLLWPQDWMKVCVYISM